MTGGSRGIGLTVAHRLAERGARLALCARDATSLAAAADDLRERHGASVVAVPTDVTNPRDQEQFRDLVLRELGPPDGLLNNAATLGPVGPLATVDISRWEATIRTNLVGPAAMIAAFAPAMAARGHGSIVNIAGGGAGGPRTQTNVSAYVTSKVALVALTETVARELAPDGVRVNAIAPGPIATSFTDEILTAGPGMAGQALYEETVANRNHGSSIEPFLDLLEFMLSDESSWLSGRLLTARWDPPEAVGSRRQRIQASSLFQLRRIDDVLYGELQ